MKHRQFRVTWGGGQKYSIIFFTFLISLFFSCQNYSVSDEGIDQDSDDSSSQKVEIFTEGGLKYAIINRSVAIYGLDDNTDRVNLVIPAEINGIPVTEIAENAFYEEKAIASVEFPESLVKIGKYAFYKCTSLSKIELPKNVKSIEHAFVSCTSLSEVTLNDGIEDIASAFYDDRSIKSIRVPASVVSMDNAFGDCTELTDVVLEEGLTVVSGFYNCYKLEEIKIPSSVKTIASYAFCNSGLKELVIPEGVETIKNRFIGDTGITEITLPTSLKTLDDFCFAESSITNLVIPDSVTLIGKGAFMESKIESVNIPPKVTVLNDSLFERSSLKEIYIPKTIEKIGSFIFSQCENLQKVTIACDLSEDVSLTEIKDSDSADSANLNFKESLDKEKAVEVLDPDNEHYDYFEYGDDDEYHYYCAPTKKIVDVVFEDTVKTVCGKIFSGNFKKLDLGSVTKIADVYFKAEEIVFPENEVTVGGGVARCQIEADRIYLNGAITPNSGISFYVKQLYINADLTDEDDLHAISFHSITDSFYHDENGDYHSVMCPIELYVADSVTSFPPCFYFEDVVFDVFVPESFNFTYACYENCEFNCEMKMYGEFDWTVFTECTFNKPVTVGHLTSKQGGRFFKDCNIKNLIVTENPISSLCVVGDYKTSEIEKLEFTDDVTRIESECFKNIRLSGEIDLSNITYIGQKAFIYDDNPDGAGNCKFIFSQNPTVLHSHAFFGQANAEFEFNGEILLTPDDIYAFSYCKNLKEMPVIKGCIPEKTFWDCESLKEIKIGPDVFLGPAAFMKTTGVEKISVDSANPHVFEKDGIFIYQDFLDDFGEMHLSYAMPSKCPQSVSVDERTTHITSCAFYGCNNLKEIDLMNIKRINGSAFESCESLEKVTLKENSGGEIGERAFYECKNLKQIDLSKFGVCGYAFYKCSSLEGEITVPYIDGQYVFYGCSSITKATVNHCYVTPISAFYFEGMDYAFAECTNLKEFQLGFAPPKVEEDFCARYAFQNCTSLERVVYYGYYKQPLFMETKGIFEGCTSIKEVINYTKSGYKSYACEEIEKEYPGLVKYVVYEE